MNVRKSLDDYLEASRTACSRFDEAVQVVTEERGQDYGPPGDDFRRASYIKDAVAACPDRAVRHALEMIGVKMARLTNSPYHLDSVIDIAGYARTIAMIIDEETQKMEREYVG